MLKKALFSALLLVSVAYAGSFKVGDYIGFFSLPNQFDKKVSINSRINTILVSFEKGTGAEVNAFLASKPKDFLERHNAVFIANIAGMPSIITKLFAMPKMREYKHSILLIYDDGDDRFVKEEGKTTLYRVENGVIKSISYVTKDELEGVFK